MTISKKLCGAAAALGAAFATSLPAWAQDAAATAPVPDPGNNAWMMTATILVLLMILPGLALFYGGLTRSKNMLSTMTQIGAAAAMAMLIWVVWGYGTAFGPEGNKFIAWGNYFLSNVTPDSTAATFTKEVISEYVFVSFQMTFAAITIALVIGSVVERMKFSALMVFTPVWLTIVYFPIAHMVWAGGGLFFDMGALDFAGGTVVHINAGVSALVACLLLGKRMGYPKTLMLPHSPALTMAGAALLWVGWFGFNGGSALAANDDAASAIINTHAAACAAALVWLLIERIAVGKPTSVGFATGAVAGLATVTPAAGFIAPGAAILFGVAASALCYPMIQLVKKRLHIDDSLDVFAV
ncbi:MAG: ammonia channel protein, partial [Sphingobium sp. 32-64-5]